METNTRAGVAATIATIYIGNIIITGTHFGPLWALSAALFPPVSAFLRS